MQAIHSFARPVEAVVQARAEFAGQFRRNRHAADTVLAPVGNWKTVRPAAKWVAVGIQPGRLRSGSATNMPPTATIAMPASVKASGMSPNTRTPASTAQMIWV